MRWLVKTEELTDYRRTADYFLTLNKFFHMLMSFWMSKQYQDWDRTLESSLSKHYTVKWRSIIDSTINDDRRCHQTETTIRVPPQPQVGPIGWKTRAFRHFDMWTWLSHVDCRHDSRSSQSSGIWTIYLLTIIIIVTFTILLFCEQPFWQF